MKGDIETVAHVYRVSCSKVGCDESHINYAGGERVFANHIELMGWSKFIEYTCPKCNGEKTGKASKK